MRTISGLILLFMVSTAHAQELDEFLDCANYSDRLERVICLESALEEAVSEQSTESAAENEEVAAVENFGNARGATASDQSDQEAEDESSERSFFRLPSLGLGNIFRRNSDQPEGTIYTPSRRVTENTEQEAPEVEDNPANETERVENFGRESRVVVNAEGEDELMGVVAEIERIRPNLLRVTLEGGQIWQQRFVKNYNLRVGDSVRIYPSGWGENFRLEADRLSGFIQVGRVQ